MDHQRLAFFPSLRDGIGRLTRLLNTAEGFREKLLLESSLEAFRCEVEFRRGLRFFSSKHPSLLFARIHPNSAGQFNHDVMAIISAENPDGIEQPSAENQRLTEALAGYLANRGIFASSLSIGAADGSRLEQGFLIGANTETAVEIGALFNQVAVFMIYNQERVVLISCRGEGRHRLGTLKQMVIWPPLSQRQNPGPT